MMKTFAEMNTEFKLIDERKKPLKDQVTCNMIGSFCRLVPFVISEEEKSQKKSFGLNLEC